MTLDFFSLQNKTGGEYHLKKMEEYVRSIPDFPKPSAAAGRRPPLSIGTSDKRPDG